MAQKCKDWTVLLINTCASRFFLASTLQRKKNTGLFTARWSCASEESSCRAPHPSGCMNKLSVFQPEII